MDLCFFSCASKYYSRYASVVACDYFLAWASYISTKKKQTGLTETRILMLAKMSSQSVSFLRNKIVKQWNIPCFRSGDFDRTCERARFCAKGDFPARSPVLLARPFLSGT